MLDIVYIKINILNNISYKHYLFVTLNNLTDSCSDFTFSKIKRPYICSYTCTCATDDDRYLQIYV